MKLKHYDHDGNSSVRFALWQSVARHSKGLLVAFIVISGILSLLRFDSFQVGGFPDDAHYVVLAESLSSGQGYRLINFPHAPVELAFPPGWPLLLAPVAALFPDNFTALKLLSLIFWLASLPLIYRFFTRRLKTPYLEMLIALVALNPIWIGFSGMIMSEAAYLFFSFLALNLFDSWESQHSKSKVWLLIAIAGVALYTQLIRTVGLSILFAIIGYLLYSRRFRQAAIVTAVIFLGLFLQLWLNPQDSGSIISSGYHSQVLDSSLAAKLTQMWTNLQSYMKGIIASALVFLFKPESISAPGKPAIGYMLLNAFILLTIVLGICRVVLRRFQISELYVGVYFLGILAFWNPDVPSAQVRYLIPILPFLYFYMIRAIEWVAFRITGKHDKRSVLVTTGLILPIILLSLAGNLKDKHDSVPDRFTDLSVGTDWIAGNTPPESVIMTRNPITDYLYSKRKTVNYPLDENHLEDYIKKQSVDYIIISPKVPALGRPGLDSFTKRLLLPVLAANSDKFLEVYTDTFYDVTVYSVVGQESPTPANSWQVSERPALLSTSR